MEAFPEGTVDIFATVDGSKEVQLKWLAPNKPNGKLTYTVLVTGLFYTDEGIFFFLYNKSNDSIDIPFHLKKNPLTVHFSAFFCHSIILELSILFLKNCCFDLWCFTFVQTHKSANKDKPSALI